MDGTFIILFLTLLLYIPLAGALLYVWWKYGRGELGVRLARVTFVVGSVVILFYMITL